LFDTDWALIYHIRVEKSSQVFSDSKARQYNKFQHYVRLNILLPPLSITSKVKLSRYMPWRCMGGEEI
jgi:hypothetical protein